MSAHLTYRPRQGVVFGTVAGKAIRQAALQDPAGLSLETWRQAARSTATRVTDWSKTQELRSGRTAGSPGPALTIAENAALEIYDYPGEFAQRFDGVDPGSGAARHRQHARVVWVKLALKTGFPAGGICLHGPPPCGDRRCIVIVQDWDSLFLALKTARQVSVVVEL
jgi:hypothetical protein